ncbi:MAG: M20/M25/M40 family metallo-hydrolase [Candidatus Thermoplasmatota archaeon]|nr:M20/M25/M40 family metallo-hydrolase [Candidatus Thermoplasmatota archaeon]
MDEAIELLKDAVSIDSVTGDTHRCTRFLMEWCLDKGMEAVIDGGAVIVNPKARGLLLLGHLDTVPGCGPIMVEDGFIKGRGSVDAKGPLCAALYALSQLPEAHDRVMLVAVPDEEGCSSTARRLRDSLPQMPCIVLEPGGWNGITISYRGRILADMMVRAKRSHSGAEGRFSAEVAVEMLNEVKKKCDPRIVSMKGDIERTEARLDIRYPMGSKPRLENTSESWFYVLEDTPPYRADKGSHLVRSLLGSIRNAGGSPSFKNKTGTSDMNVLGEKWTAPIVAYGPGDSKLDHTDDERIHLEEYIKGIQVLKGAISSSIRQ